LDAAKARAATAASCVATRAKALNRALHLAMTQAAGIAVQGVQGGVPQDRQPIDMFNANHIDHMYQSLRQICWWDFRGSCLERVSPSS